MFISKSKITEEYLTEIAFENTLDAIYSFYCLGMDCYYDGKWDEYYTIINDEIVPKYCKAYGRKYIIEKVKRVLKKNGISQRH